MERLRYDLKLDFTDCITGVSKGMNISILESGNIHAISRGFEKLTPEERAIIDLLSTMAIKEMREGL